MSPIKKITASLFLTFSLSGCSFLYDTFVYQIDITQGNYIDDEKIDMLKLGMTQEQVIYILGSPMLIDEFDSSKWYFIRSIKPGGEKLQEQKVVLTFKDKLLVTIDKESKIDETPLIKNLIGKAEPNKAASEDNTSIVKKPSVLDE